MKHLIFLFLMAVMTACDGGYVPREGDLLFQTESCSEYSDAITAATAGKDTVKFIHVAMVALDEKGRPYVLEASDEKGVTRTSLDEFIRSSAGKSRVVVKRVNMDFPVHDAIMRAEKHLGEEYDWEYLPSNGKMYCSELVYECYLSHEGTHLFKSAPMNFRDEEGNIPSFWTELFESVGTDVPQGVPGTNPHDMSKEDILDEVYRFF